MEFLNENTIIGEMSDEQFKEEIKKKAKERKKWKLDQRDGHLCVYSEQFEYKGISYLIKIHRYYQIGVPIYKIQGINKIGKWAVLEHYPTLITNFVRLIESFGNLINDPKYIDFLWGDTRFNDGSLEQMVELMHQKARNSINGLKKLDVKFYKFMRKKRIEFKKLQKLISKLNKGRD